jgi:arylsulfatase A-like enzyme
VILIVIDTLRPDRMGVYGHRPMGFSTTPNLDKMADGGAVFTDAVSTSSWTLPTHWALLTGLADELHDVVDDRVPPPADVPLLAELLKKNGYSTAGFYSGPYLHPFFGFGRGFDTYESCMDFTTVYDVAEQELEAYTKEKVAELTARTEKQSHEAVTSKLVTDKAASFVEEKGGEPFFLFLHYFDVHNDYTPPSPFDTRFSPPYSGWVDGRGVTTDPRINPEMKPEDLGRLKSYYDGEIGWVDENIGRFLRAIERLRPGILENTLLVVTSDHGEEFFEHGSIGHRKSLYEESIRIPLIMSFPGRVPSGVRVNSPSRIYDILPTIMDLLELPAPPLLSGRSLRSSWEEKDTKPRPALSELTRVPRGRDESYTKLISLRAGGLKLITTQKRAWSPEKPIDFTGGLIAERHELYDLAADPSETRNLQSERKDLLKKALDVREVLFEEMRGLYLELRNPSAADPRSIPEDVMRRLLRAGYLH